LSDILENAAKELQSFLFMDKSSRIAYRPTSLDTASVLQSLVAHVVHPDDSFLPVARHGAGMVSLQAFLILLAFAAQRKQSNRNFVLAAEEPELHLHPSLHQRLINRIRATSVQSIVTTQSPYVADGYQPQEVVFVRNTIGQMQATRLRETPIKTLAYGYDHINPRRDI
jgi:putative ATP-dependent endonuclease of OLD family